jgi:hypothetical protein
MLEPRRKKPGRPSTGRISVHVFLDKKLDEELSKVASREGVHRSLIVERALARELQVSVNLKDLGHLERALEHLLSAEKLLSSAGVKTP